MGYAPINGFPALDYGDARLATYTVPGTNPAVHVSLLKETAPLFLALLRDWNAEVEKLDPKQCWGHAFRAVRDSTSTSFHACGIACDCNSAKHPLAVHPTFTAAQVAAARRVLARFKYAGVALFRWGFDYTGRKDDMHVELIVSRAIALKAVAALQAHPTPVPKPGPVSTAPGKRVLKAGMTGPDVAFVQRFIGPTRMGAADGIAGPKFTAGVRWYQGLRGLAVDGIVGPKTWAQMGVRA